MVVGERIPWLPVVRLHAVNLVIVFLIATAVALAPRYLEFRPAISPLPFSVVGVPEHSLQDVIGALKHTTIKGKKPTVRAYTD